MKLIAKIAVITGVSLTALCGGFHYYMRRNRDVLLNSRCYLRAFLDPLRERLCPLYVVSGETSPEEFKNLMIMLKSKVMINGGLFFDVLYKTNINNIPQKLIAVLLVTRPGLIPVLIRLDQITYPLPEEFIDLFTDPLCIKFSSKSEYKAFILWKFLEPKVCMKNIFDVEFLNVNGFTMGKYYRYLYKKATTDTKDELSSFFTGQKATEAIYLFYKLSFKSLESWITDYSQHHMLILNPTQFIKDRYNLAQLVQWGPHPNSDDDSLNEENIEVPE